MVFRKRTDVTPLPIPRPQSLTPSGTFDGDDGRWSTFYINVAGDGNGQGQNFRVLISTSSPVTIVPARSSWCSTDECAKNRGIMGTSGGGAQALGFDTSNSQTWQPLGFYSLPVNSTYWFSRDVLLLNRNDTLGADWGSTTVGLGMASKQSNTIDKQWVATSLIEDYYLGSLGLSAGEVGPDKAQTFFSSLASQTELIPSNSYGYTAGAAYRTSFLVAHIFTRTFASGMIATSLR